MFFPQYTWMVNSDIPIKILNQMECTISRYNKVQLPEQNYSHRKSMFKQNSPRSVVFKRGSRNRDNLLKRSFQQVVC